ncbi:hypothetical protein SAMN05216330_101420 [Bradyrhizobium sp. Ghvi]|nr:hypothetical protein SAMN05216330_101420 [Bradyrhizobium sp. Ghvi]
MAHQGAAHYINDGTKSFMDKYTDLVHLGAAALSVIGSIFAAIYAKIHPQGDSNVVVVKTAQSA